MSLCLSVCLPFLFLSLSLVCLYPLLYFVFRDKSLSHSLSVFLTSVLFCFIFISATSDHLQNWKVERKIVLYISSIVARTDRALIWRRYNKKSINVFPYFLWLICTTIMMHTKCSCNICSPKHIYYPFFIFLCWSTHKALPKVHAWKSFARW